MLLARRLGDLQIATQRLRSIKRNALQATLFRDNGQTGELRNKTIQQDGGILRRNLPHAVRQQRNRSEQVQRERLLFRKVPLLLSQVERSVAHLEKKQLQAAAALSNTAALPQGGQQEIPIQQLTDGGSFWTLQQQNNSSSTSSSSSSSSNTFLRETSDARVSLEIVQSAGTESLPKNRQSKSYHIIVVSQLLRLLNFLEDERRQLYKEKLAFLAHKYHLSATNYEKFRQEFDKQLRQPHNRRAESYGAKPSRADEAALSSEDAALLRETEQHLQKQVRHSKEDMELLRKSILARPYLSAAMWKQLLKNRIWLPFLSLRRNDQDAVFTENGVNAEEQLILLEMLTALVRLSFGALHSYVAEGFDVSKRSPRFVVSLPSAAYRARHESLPSVDTKHNEEQGKTNLNESSSPRVQTSKDLTSDAPDDDLLFEMLSPDTSEASAVAPQASKKRQRKMARPVLREVRWMPTHASEMLTLTIETLALVSFLLPVLDVPLLLSQGLRAAGPRDGSESNNLQLLLQLMIRVQKMALVVLSLRSDQPAAASEDLSTHTVLHRLEKELVELGLTLKYELLEAIAETEAASNVEKSASHLSLLLLQRTSPSAAARMLIEMESLHLVARPSLLESEETASFDRKRTVDASLVSYFALLVFPSLKTNTRQALQRKGADAVSTTTGTQSLFAFTTRNHRKKLLQRFNHNKGQVESYLLGTIVQQNRLRQRMLSAALHKNYVEKIVEQSHMRLGQELTRLELVSLFQLFCSFAAVQHQQHFGGDGGLQTDNMLLTAALCTSEAILLNGLFTTPNGATSKDATPLSHGNAFLFSMNDLTKMWSSLVILAPIVYERHEAARESQRFARFGSAGGGGGAGFQMSEAQKNNQIVHFLLMEVLAGINELVAAHAKQCRASSPQGERKIRTTVQTTAEGDADKFTAVHVTHLVSALQSWAQHRGANRGFRDVEEQVQLLVRLLKEVLIHDTALRREVRSLPLEQREGFEKLLLDCFQASDALDTTLTQALQTMCYRL